MIETEYRLETSAQATLDASGSGSQLNVGPARAGERWVIRFLGASGPSRSKLYVVRGNSFDPSRQLDYTAKADGDTSPTNIELQSNEVISFWWTGGVPGTIMLCSIQGSSYVPGRRAY